MESMMFMGTLETVASQQEVVLVGDCQQVKLPEKGGLVSPSFNVQSSCSALVLIYEVWLCLFYLLV